MSASVKAEDGRRQGWYWADNSTMRLVLTKLGPFGAAVYTALAIRSNSQREAWPDVEVLAADAGMSRRRAVAALADLVEIGVLEVAHRRSVDGRQAASVYRLIDPAAARVQDVHPGKPAARVQDVHPGKPAARVQETAGQSAGNSRPECTTCTHIEEQYPRTIHKNKNNSSPFGVVVVAPPAPLPAPPDDDDDAPRADGMAAESRDDAEDDEARDAIEDILGANPCRNAAERARICLVAIRRACPTATVDDIRDAADEWSERMERIKRKAPDPLQASQLPALVAAYVKAVRTASRAGHGIVPMIER